MSHHATSYVHTASYFVDNTRPGVIYRGTPDEVAMAVRGLTEEGGDPWIVSSEKALLWVNSPELSPVPEESWRWHRIPPHWLRCNPDVALIEHPHVDDLVKRAALELKTVAGYHRLNLRTEQTDVADNGEDAPALNIGDPSLKLFPRRTDSQCLKWVVRHEWTLPEGDWDSEEAYVGTLAGACACIMGLFVNEYTMRDFTQAFNESE